MARIDAGRGSNCLWPRRACFIVDFPNAFEVLVEPIFIRRRIFPCFLHLISTKEVLPNG